MPVYKITWLFDGMSIGTMNMAAKTAKDAKDKLRKKVKGATSVSASIAAPSTKRVKKKRDSDKQNGLHRKEFLVDDNEFEYLKNCLATYRGG